MTKDDIIKLAREAQGTPYVNRHYPGVTSFGFSETALERFANLVAAAEREACAGLLESRKTNANSLIDAVRDMEAAAIRARTAP